MARKNGMKGAIPGAGRKLKGYKKKNLNISPEAASILEALPFGAAGEFVSSAIVAFNKLELGE